MKSKILPILAVMMIGVVLLTGASAAPDILATPFADTGQQIFLNGAPVQMQGYNIGGHNYFMLRDIGKALGFNVYWDDGVHIDTSSPYTGAAPEDAPALAIGSYKGSTLTVGERSGLIISRCGADTTVSSSAPSILAVEAVGERWTAIAKSPGTATISVTAADGQRGTLTITVTDGTPAASLPSVSADDLQANLDIREEIISLVNEVRHENGAPALTVNQSLMNAAQECATKRFTWHHTQEECESALRYGYPHGVSVNLTVFSGASNADVAQTAVTNWVNSPGHFRTMIDTRGDCLGVGVAQYGGVSYCYLFVGLPGAYNPYS